MYYSLFNIATRHIIRLTFGSYQPVLINQLVSLPSLSRLTVLFYQLLVDKTDHTELFSLHINVGIWAVQFKKKKCIPEIAANMKALISALIVRHDFLKDNSTQRNNLIEFLSGRENNVFNSKNSVYSLSIADSFFSLDELSSRTLFKWKKLVWFPVSHVLEFWWWTFQSNDASALYMLC